MEGGAPIAREGVSQVYGKGALAKQVQFYIETQIEGGQIIILTGPSGSAKTTLLTLIGALRSPQKCSERELGH